MCGEPLGPAPSPPSTWAQVKIPASQCVAGPGNKGREGRCRRWTGGGEEGDAEPVKPRVAITAGLALSCARAGRTAGFEDGQDMAQCARPGLATGWRTRGLI